MYVWKRDLFTYLRAEFLILLRYFAEIKAIRNDCNDTTDKLPLFPDLLTLFAGAFHVSVLWRGVHTCRMEVRQRRMLAGKPEMWRDNTVYRRIRWGSMR